MMKNKELRGFSLAELLISLLIISIVLSAAIPTITRKSAKSNEFIWRWTKTNNCAYFGVGANQTAIIGASEIPFKNNDKSAGTATTNADYLKNFFPSIVSEYPKDDISHTKFSLDGDKLILLKRTFVKDNKTDNFINSHISFYNLEGDTKNQITYGGRIATDRHNLAFGIGTLQNLISLDSYTMSSGSDLHLGYNTAIGHYALFKNEAGQYNTALGEEALTFNRNSSYNTAIGYKALNSTNPDHNVLSGEDEIQPGGNTGVGTYSLYQNTIGSENTAIGKNALGANIEGNFNTAIGANACSQNTGNNNICIGYNAGFISKDVKFTSDGISNPLNDNNAFYLGYDELTVPLMYGHTSKVKTITGKKDLIFNVENFQIKTADSQIDPIFNIDIESEPTDDSGTPSKKDTKFDFLLGNKNTGDLSPSILTLSGNKNGDVAFNFHDKFDQSRNVIFNDIFKINFEDNTSGKTVQLYALADNTNSGTGSVMDSTNISLNDKFIVNNNSNASVTLYNFDNSENLAFSLKEINSDSHLQMSNFGELKIKMKDNISIDSDKDVSINSTGSLNIKSKNITFHNYPQNDIEIKGLEYSNGLVAQGIRDLWKEFNALKQATGQYSDARLKDIKGDNTSGLKEINMLEVKDYTYKNDKEKKTHVGIIAQQLQKVFPNSVIKDNEGYLKITTEEIFYAMVNAIKELTAKIQDLTAKVTGLDKRITELEKQNAQLMKQNAEFEKRLSKLEKSAK